MDTENPATPSQREDEEEDPVALCSSTLAVLNQFLEQRSQAENLAREDPFAENWGMSQFWYTDETSERIAQQCASVAQGGAVACVACPSLFRKLKQKYPAQQCHLFEFDPRFEVLGDFSLYDYNKPFSLAAELKGCFEVVVIDPPYLSRECLEKTIQTMKVLGKPDEAIFLALTGASMRSAARELLDLRPVRWRPQHKSKLGNEFCLYAMHDSTAAQFGGWDSDIDF